MITVDVIGSCIVRDIFRFSSEDNYKVNLTIQRNPISRLYERGGVKFPLDINLLKESHKFERKCFKILWEKKAVDLLNINPADYMILDLSEERLNALELLFENQKIDLVETAIFDKLLNEMASFYPEMEWRLKPYNFRKEDDIKENYIKFRRGILKEEESGGVWEERQIIVIETYMLTDYITMEGMLRKYRESWNIEEINGYLKRCYELFYEVFPNCSRIKLPAFSHGHKVHMWGAHPLHYQDSVYEYFLEAISIIAGRSCRSTLEKLQQQQAIENRLYTRLLNSTKVYEIDRLRKEIDYLNNFVREQNRRLVCLEKKIKQRNKKTCLHQGRKI